MVNTVMDFDDSLVQIFPWRSQVAQIHSSGRNWRQCQFRGGLTQQSPQRIEPTVVVAMYKLRTGGRKGGDDTAERHKDQTGDAEQERALPNLGCHYVGELFQRQDSHNGSQSAGADSDEDE